MERTRARSGAIPWRRPGRGIAAASPEVVAAVDARGVGPHARADPPLDVAFYQCSCGYVFEAAVSTAVTCPHCASQQAW